MSMPPSCSADGDSLRAWVAASAEQLGGIDI